MIEKVCCGLLCVVAFLMGGEYSKLREGRACDARVAQAKTNAENFLTVEAKKNAEKYQADEAKMIEQFNSAIRSNVALYQKRLEEQKQAFMLFYSRMSPRGMLPQGPPVPAAPSASKSEQTGPAKP